MQNYIMIQFFEWFLPNNGTHWKTLEQEAPHLKNLGVNMVWLPPCGKATGQDSVGYDVYDLYDLGEFDQKGTIRTRYGFKDDLLSAIATLHHHDILAIADVILNHKAGADQTETFMAVEVDAKDRLKVISEARDIEGWTQFNFEGRNNQYSDFKWHFQHFTATDRDEKEGVTKIFRILGDFKEFSPKVDSENANYDYLMFADIHHQHPEVAQELQNWGLWLSKTLDLDGFRLDAVKHIDEDFMKNFVNFIRDQINPSFFVVGEYWQGDLSKLEGYLNRMDYNMHLFDAPLHYKFVTASQEYERFNLSEIFSHTLVASHPLNAVTFVENHDSQREAYVGDWFKPLAYALILLRHDGYPCLFYGDYYGTQDTTTEHMSFRESLDQLCYARKDLAYGEQVDYFDHPNVIGWIRKGDDEHEHSGIAVLISNSEEGTKKMTFDPSFKGKSFYDVLGGRSEIISLDEDGSAIFTVSARSVAVWAIFHKAL